MIANSANQPYGFDLVAELRSQLRFCGDPAWMRNLSGLSASERGGLLHLAVMQQPWLNQLLKREKTIESRWSAKRMSAYRTIGRDDLIALKESSGPVVGLAMPTEVQHVELDCPGAWDRVRRLAGQLCVDDAFYAAQWAKGAKYVALIWIGAVLELTPFWIPKTDRHAWVVFGDGFFGDR